MVAIAIGWQIYDLARLTRSIEESAFMLGMVGLTQFTPILLLSLPGGQAADRFDRKKILVWSNTVRFFVILSLFAASFADAHIAAAEPLTGQDDSGETGDQGAVDVEERPDLGTGRAGHHLGHRTG